MGSAGTAGQCGGGATSGTRRSGDRWRRRGAPTAARRAAHWAARPGRTGHEISRPWVRPRCRFRGAVGHWRVDAPVGSDPPPAVGVGHPSSSWHRSRSTKSTPCPCQVHTKSTQSPPPPRRVHHRSKPQAEHCFAFDCFERQTQLSTTTTTTTTCSSSSSSATTTRCAGAARRKERGKEEKEKRTGCAARPPASC